MIYFAMNNYLDDLMHCLRPDTDENEPNAFSLNDSREEPDEFSPESVFGPDTDCMGNCFTDADPGL